MKITKENIEKAIVALRKCAKENEGKVTDTGAIRVSDLCNDVADYLECTESERKVCGAYEFESFLDKLFGRKYSNWPPPDPNPWIPKKDEKTGVSYYEKTEIIDLSNAKKEAVDYWIDFLSHFGKDKSELMKEYEETKSLKVVVRKGGFRWESQIQDDKQLKEKQP